MLTDNEISREQNFIDRIAVFKKRTSAFFADYENPSGSEDRLEICLIRDGCRAISQAEETINRQQAEIKRLDQNLKESFAEIEALKQINLTYKAEAYKEIAESVKIKTLAMVHSPGILTTADYIKCIDDIVKEWVGENND